jgi:hypothetical protein
MLCKLAPETVMPLGQEFLNLQLRTQAQKRKGIGCIALLTFVHTTSAVLQSL